MASDCIITTEELMNLLRVSRQTISNWKDQGMPNYARGQWNVKEVLGWFVAKTQVERSTNQEDGDHDAEKMRKTRIEADLKQLELDQLVGKLIPMETATYELSRVMTIVKSTIISIPNKIAPQIVGRPLKEVKLILQSELNESVRAIDFSEYYKVPLNGDRSGKPRKAARKTKAK